MLRRIKGDYFGATYDPETQFDINQEPAITEKSSSLTGVKLGELNIQNAFLGTTPIISLYLGANLIDSVGIEPYTTSKVPDTQFRTNSNSYSGFETGPISVSSGQKLWIDVQNFVAARTYYTLDGSTPTTSSTLYQDHITLTQSCTVKALTVSVSGVSEVVRTLDVTVTGLLPVTTVSPSTTVQNSTSVTVTLSATDATTTYYKMGTGAQQTYSAPFTVSQNTAGVLSSVFLYIIGQSAQVVQRPKKLLLMILRARFLRNLSERQPMDTIALDWIGPQQQIRQLILSIVRPYKEVSEHY